MKRSTYEKLRAQIDLADDIYGDLPDGAYWAACEEMGVGPDVQAEVDDYELINQLGLHSNG